MSPAQNNDTAFLATIDWLKDYSVSFETVPLVNGSIFDGDDRIPVADIQRDGYSDMFVVLDEQDNPELREELTGILQRRFEYQRECGERQRRLEDKRAAAGLPRRVLPIGAPAPPVTLKMLQKARYDSTEARDMNIAYFKMYGTTPEDFDEDGKPLPPPVKNSDSTYDMTPEEIEAQYEAEYPVFRLPASAGPVFEDSDLYGPLGQVAKIVCQFSEAHVVTVYLNLIVSIGNLFGRGAYFNIAQTRHFTNENLACVGDTSRARKGSASDGAESFLRAVDGAWLSMRNVSGFATPQAVISEIRDNDEFQKLNSKSKQYETIHREGVADKRLCIREGELSNVFKLLSDPKQKAGELVRNLWDGKPISNKVAGKSADGEHNSLMCREPHVSIVGSTTPSLAKMTLPIGADKSGDGNRFIWCYTKRTQLCPNGGPQIDWASVTIEYAGKAVSLLVYMQEMLRDVVFGDSEVSLGYRLIPLTKAAAKFWLHLYLRLEKDQREGFLGGMTSRAAAHIRRLAMILCLVDREGAVDVKHLKAAEAIWNYSQESACFIFKGYSLEQEKILRYAHEKGAAGITIGRELHALFSRNRSSDWLRAQVCGLAETGYLTESNDVYKFKKF